PILTDRGLAAALEAHSRRTALAMRVFTDGVGRFSSDVESAIYFCCLEGVQNAAKHSGANHVDVILERTEGNIAFYIRDDGKGFDGNVGHGAGLQNISDRVAALSGRVVVSTGPQGTTVSGWVPATPI
ncbi:MAG: sensor histidine kinase, partial [Actinomycetota bacterium]